MICHKPQFYLEFAKCKPTAADGDTILLFSIAIKQWVPVSTRVVLDMIDYYKAHYSHWMQMPKAPAEDDVHAFLE